MTRLWVLAILCAGLLATASGCDEETRGGGDSDSDSDSDTDSDADTDADSDADSDSDECYEGNYTIGSEDDYTAFESFTCITGELSIDGWPPDDEPAISISFPNLVWVGGRLMLKGVYLEDATFPSLQEVAGNEVRLQACDVLGDVEFPVLTTVDSVVFSSNQGIDGQVSFPNLTELVGNLHLISNNNVPHLNGLSSLTWIGGQLHLLINQGLASISALSGLEYVGSSLHLRGNDDLPTCEATDLLEQLQTEGYSGAVCIKNNLVDDCEEILDDCP